MTKTKQTARTMRQMIGCSVSYLGVDGEITAVHKCAEWMLRVALVDGRVAILKTSEIR
jgi:hypothetical protein